MELQLEDRLALLEPTHQLHEGPFEPVHLLRQVRRVQVLAWLQLLAPLLWERLDREHVRPLLQARVDADPEKVGSRRPFLLQQRQEQLKLLEAEFERRLYADV